MPVSPRVETLLLAEVMIADQSLGGAKKTVVRVSALGPLTSYIPGGEELHICLPAKFRLGIWAFIV